MIDYTSLFDLLAQTPLRRWLDALPAAIADAMVPEKHGEIARWSDALARLPRVAPSSIDLHADAVRAGTAGDLEAAERNRLAGLLDEFHPWRKGPFDIMGIGIDTEWRSNWKWDRLAGAISPLKGRRVLDVGAGNGYYGWRMLGAGAELVVGIDPYLLYVMQYQAVRHFLRDLPAYVLPLGIEDVPEWLTGFDTVFSMGVLYHRRSPEEHLKRLFDILSDDGELVLETLVVDGGPGEVLRPRGRYARMRNVWAIPSPAALSVWLHAGGFRQLELVDVSVTTTDEQRATPWMRFESLSACLDPDNPAQTVEGYPAPRRAIVVARKH